MLLTIHGHFYQPPREDPWTGRIPVQGSAAPFHDWNERIAAECYAPNARSRVLDEKGRIEEIVSNYEWIHFDFGPTLLRWLETNDPQAYRAILEGDARSMRRFGGHGNAIAQAYNHMIMPLANYRDQRTQVIWGLRDFEHRFGRKSESIWLPETAVNLETLRILVEFGMRYLILAPSQAKRIRSMRGGGWSDVSGGRIDPRRAYRWRVPGNEEKGIDVFFYDGPVSAAVSFDHLLRNASVLADRLQMAAKGAPEEGLIHAATDGEVYGHHEPFGDMCLAYLITREGPLRGFEWTNYGAYLDQHPPQHWVDIDLGDGGDGTSWSCAHGVDRWRRDCGCSVGGKAGWNQKWRSPLRRGLDHLRDRLAEVFMASAADLVHDPWAARDDSIEILLRPDARDAFLARHARRILDIDEQRRLWRLLESQHQAMLMFTSCAWFFADISGLEVQQNLGYAARAIELAQPFARVDLEEEILSHLISAKSNLPEMGDGVGIWRRFIVPNRRSSAAVAIEAVALIAASQDGIRAESPAYAVDLLSSEGRLANGGIDGSLRVRDRATTEETEFHFAARRDPESLLRLSVRAEGSSEVCEGRLDDLPLDPRQRIVRALLHDLTEQEESRFDAIFDSSRPLMERFRKMGLDLPPIFRVLAGDVLRRRADRVAAGLGADGRDRLDPGRIVEGYRELKDLAEAIGIPPPHEPIARLIEEELDATLGDVGLVTDADAARCLDLLGTAEGIGVPIRRTRLEERVYALISEHRDAVAARLAGRADTVSGLDPEILIRLAEHSNLSLRPWADGKA